MIFDDDWWCSTHFNSILLEYAANSHDTKTWESNVCVCARRTRAQPFATTIYLIWRQGFYHFNAKPMNTLHSSKSIWIHQLNIIPISMAFSLIYSITNRPNIYFQMLISMPIYRFLRKKGVSTVNWVMFNHRFFRSSLNDSLATISFHSSTQFNYYFGGLANTSTPNFPFNQHQHF